MLYRYDRNGNCTQRRDNASSATLGYSWDQANRLVGFQYSQNPSRNVGYVYDGDGCAIASRSTRS